jgi:hypothetical protein
MKELKRYLRIKLKTLKTFKELSPEQTAEDIYQYTKDKIQYHSFRWFIIGLAIGAMLVAIRMAI